MCDSEKESDLPYLECENVKEMFLFVLENEEKKAETNKEEEKPQRLFSQFKIAIWGKEAARGRVGILLNCLFVHSA